MTSPGAASGKVWVAIDVVRWVDDEPQPGIVECTVTAADGRELRFLEKAVVTSETLLESSSYPSPGWVEGEVVSRQPDRSDALVEVRMDQRWLDTDPDWKERIVIVRRDQIR